MRQFLAAAMAVTCAMAAVPGAAQNRLADIRGAVETAPATVGGDHDFGTAADIVYTLFGHDLEIFQGTEGPVNGSTGARLCQTGPCGWLGGIQLPTGAVIRRIELSGCDGDAAQQIQFLLFAQPRVPGALALLAQGTTGGPAAPGCNVFGVDLAPTRTVQNAVETLFLDVLESPGTNVQWNQVRIIYRLQVSPAPAVATFNDVPTGHFAFRFVEAMVASGITGGCGAGAYCPDSPVTRAQMAIFLATALGLHFPN